MTATARYASPPTTFFGGHLAQFRADRIGFVTRCIRDYGDFVELRNLHLRCWLVADPDVIGEVLTTHAGHFRKDVGLQRTKILIGDGLLTSEGEVHARRSRLAQPAFRAQAVARYAEAMVELTEGAAAGWSRRKAVDLPTELSALALAIVGRTLFGADLRDVAPALGEALTEVLEFLSKRYNSMINPPLFLPTPRNRRFFRAKKVLDDAVLGMIQACREGAEDRPDLLSELLTAREEDGRGLTDDELRDEVLTLFLAGHETTANALAFTFWLLEKHGDVRERLREEVDGALGGRRPTARDMASLPYTQQVFQEALRLYPPVWGIARQAVDDVVLGGGRLHVRKGQMVGLCAYAVHRDPRWWPEPDEFRPERFARDAPRPRPYTYFPFGGGKRACIGRSFALLEGVMVLATVLQRYEVQIQSDRDIEVRPRMTLRVEGDLPASLIQRSSGDVAQPQTMETLAATS